MITAESERRKYAKMWALPTYRATSPGLALAPLAYDLLAPSEGASLVDYGCGEGRAVDYFRSRGMDASGVDLVALRPDVVEACLWDLPPLSAGYAFCADVMEHIPPERVAAVLRGIRERTSVGGVFSIASVQDGHGPEVGETLHLTVEPPAWWEARLREHWSEVEYRPGVPRWRHVFIVRA